MKLNWTTTTTTNTTTTPLLPDRPYSWWHPDKTWLDILFSVTFPLVLPLHRVTQYSPIHERDQAIACMTELRQQGANLVQSKLQSQFRQWKTIAGCPIVQVDYHIPRPNQLLVDWGLATQADLPVRTTGRVPTSDTILVRIFFPLNLLGEQADEILATGSEESDVGCLLANHNLKDLLRLPNNVPLILGFHGGGLTFGTAYAQDLLDVLLKLLEERKRPIIFASVEYSLAPEYPFPAAVEEALACADHFITKWNRPIHLLGNSAGGYLATVATMELVRKSPGAIKSALIMCPMLHPASDTLSTYLNSQSSYVPHPYHNWCWRAYLQLPDSKDTAPLDERNATLDEKCAQHSNRTTWNESLYHQQGVKKSLKRLIQPTVDLPSSGLYGADAPMIILTSNRADLLYSEDQELAEQLQRRSANMTYLDHKGSHTIGTLFDPAACRELVHAWGVALFDSRQPHGTAVSCG
jgi:acetyl esterase/lipase